MIGDSEAHLPLSFFSSSVGACADILRWSVRQAMNSQFSSNFSWNEECNEFYTAGGNIYLGARLDEPRTLPLQGQ